MIKGSKPIPSPGPGWVKRSHSMYDECRCSSCIHRRASVSRALRRDPDFPKVDYSRQIFSDPPPQRPNPTMTYGSLDVDVNFIIAWIADVWEAISHPDVRLFVRWIRMSRLGWRLGLELPPVDWYTYQTELGNTFWAWKYVDDDTR